MIAGKKSRKELVSEIKSLEDKLRECKKKYNQLVQDFPHSIYDLGFKLSTAKSLKDALHICLLSAIDCSGMDGGRVYLVNEDDERITMVTHAGLPGEFFEKIVDLLLDRKNTRLHQIIEPVYFEYSDILKYLKISGDQPIKSAAILPVYSRNKIIAYLNIASQNEKGISPFSRSALERITSHIGDVIFREKHEEKLRQSEERLKLAQRVLHLGSWEYDFTSGKFSATDEMFRIHQLIPGETQYVNPAVFMRFIHPDDKETVFKKVLNAVSQKIPYEFEFRIILSHDEIRYIHSQGDVIFGDHGRVVKLIGSAHDITDKKQSEIALSQSETLLRNTFKAIPDLLTVIDRDFRVVYSNWKGRDYIPVSKRMGNPYCYSVYLGKEKPCSHCYAAEVFQTGASKSVEHTSFFDGVTREINVFPIFNASGEVEMVTEYIRDISDRKKAEKALTRQNEYMVALHETSLGILGRLELSDVLQSIVSRASEVMQMPDGFLHLYNAEKNILELKAGTGLYSEYLGFEILPGEGLTGQVWARGEDMVIDDYYSWSGRHPSPAFDAIRSVVAIPLRSGNKIDGVIGMGNHDEQKLIDPEMVVLLEQFAELAIIAIDNARLYEAMKSEVERSKNLEQERRKIEIKLRQAQKMEAIGTLAGGIAHDFNNILYPMMGYAELAIDDLPENSITRSYVEHILNGTVRARDLVQQILTFSRKKEKEFKPFKMDLVIYEALKLLRSSIPKHIEITEDIDYSLGLMLGDPSEIHQIVMNLCTNAYHAMEEHGGILKIVLKQIRLSAEEVFDSYDLSPGTYIRLTVEDSGCGMTPDILERIFDPYFSTKPEGKGTGLGLSVTHGIVERHKGVINVYSKPLKGTAFHIYFPLIEENPGAMEIVLPESDLKGTEHIFIVDDEAQIVDVTAQMLSRLGYQVTKFTSSMDALETFAKDPGKYDMVLTDMTMPNLTGDMLSKKMMEIRPDVPIIICTGFSERITEEMVEALGIKALLLKPLIKNEMMKAIREILDSTK